MFTGKVAVDQRFLSAILLLVRFLQLHGAQFFYHGSGFLTGSFLALLGVDRPSTLSTLSYHLDYYNNRRIKTKLKGLPPAIHRQQALSAA